ncbi:unnamed protein product [Amoebophrya sp. A120]|nr:unnamed protein product [Amoebophrya sp. A120]|eukprot:GSA120T00013824001.1
MGRRRSSACFSPTLLEHEEDLDHVHFHNAQGDRSFHGKKQHFPLSPSSPATLEPPDNHNFDEHYDHCSRTSSQSSAFFQRAGPFAAPVAASGRSYEGGVDHRENIDHDGFDYKNSTDIQERAPQAAPPAGEIQNGNEQREQTQRKKISQINSQLCMTFLHAVACGLLEEGEGLIVEKLLQKTMTSRGMLTAARIPDHAQEQPVVSDTRKEHHQLVGIGPENAALEDHGQDMKKHSVVNVTQQEGAGKTTTTMPQQTSSYASAAHLQNRTDNDIKTISKKSSSTSRRGPRGEPQLPLSLRLRKVLKTEFVGMLLGGREMLTSGATNCRGHIDNFEKILLTAYENFVQKQSVFPFSELLQWSRTQHENTCLAMDCFQLQKTPPNNGAERRDTEDHINASTSASQLSRHEIQKLRPYFLVEKLFTLPNFVRCEGFFEKQSPTFLRDWKRRYFVLHRGVLTWFVVDKSSAGGASASGGTSKTAGRGPVRTTSVTNSAAYVTLSSAAKKGELDFRLHSMQLDVVRKNKQTGEVWSVMSNFTGINSTTSSNSSAVGGKMNDAASMNASASAASSSTAAASAASTTTAGTSSASRILSATQSSSSSTSTSFHQMSKRTKIILTSYTMSASHQQQHNAFFSTPDNEQSQQYGITSTHLTTSTFDPSRRYIFRFETNQEAEKWARALKAHLEIFSPVVMASS